MKRFVCVTCGAEVSEDDPCAIAPYTHSGPDCRWHLLTEPPYTEAEIERSQRRLERLFGFDSDDITPR